MGLRGPKPKFRASDCHPDARHYARGLCFQCYKKENRERYTYYEWRSKLLKEYGLTQSSFDELLKSQGGCCAICGTPLDTTKKNVHVDHDHDKPGTHRNILCQSCNVGLGHFREEPILLAIAAAYLTSWRQGDPKGSE